MQEKLKEVRLYLCLAVVLAGFLPWLTLTAKMEVFGYVTGSSEVNTTITGLETFSYSLFGMFIFLIPVALMIMEFLPNMKKKLSSFYILGGILGVVISVVTFLFAKSALVTSITSKNGIDMESIDMEAKMDVKIKIGFWLILGLFIVIVLYTLMKDYAVNTQSIRELGLKGVLSGVATDVSKEISENIEMNPCPQCGSNVMSGKKFCTKCGAKMPDMQMKPTASRVSEKGVKMKSMMTVNEYIQSLKVVNCEKCHEQVSVGTKFCPNCGETIVIKVAPEKCDFCGAGLANNKKYCPDCGKEVQKKELSSFCRKCNAELLYGKNFCVECGTKVE